jgi:hypothetical protein
MANFKTKQLDVKLTDSVSVNVLPTTGHILPFAGPSNKIPTGWLLCDGTNGTPDLRGKVPGGIANVPVGGTQTHSHGYTNNVGAFSDAGFNAGSTINLASGSWNGNNWNPGITNSNSAGHAHQPFAGAQVNAWGDSGPANRATGNQANVTSRNHSHGGTVSIGPSGGAGGAQNANHAHGYNAYSISVSSDNHSHNSNALSTSSQSITHTSLPSIFYVNFIMKV